MPWNHSKVEQQTANIPWKDLPQCQLGVSCRGKAITLLAKLKTNTIQPLHYDATLACCRLQLLLNSVLSGNISRCLQCDDHFPGQWNRSLHLFRCHTRVNWTKIQHEHFIRSFCLERVTHNRLRPPKSELMVVPRTHFGSEVRHLMRFQYRLHHTCLCLPYPIRLNITRFLQLCGKNIYHIRTTTFNGRTTYTYDMLHYRCMSDQCALDLSSSWRLRRKRKR